jgi:hypothetical protein
MRQFLRSSCKNLTRITDKQRWHVALSCKWGAGGLVAVELLLAQRATLYDQVFYEDHYFYTDTVQIETQLLQNQQQILLIAF